MTISAKVILDSFSAEGKRITTFELLYPRYVHDDLLTHRQLSRNASSTRAIPIDRFMKDTIDNPVEPIFMKNRAGMEAVDPIEGEDLRMASYVWGKAHEAALLATKTLAAIGVHKQIANRLLMPFVNIRVIVTATDLDNFFKLRLDNSAQQEVQEVAKAMKKALEESTPNLVESMNWHIPYVSEEEIQSIPLSELLDISAARCARVSYDQIHNVTKSKEDDIALAIRLASNGHLSPFEHQATPVDAETIKTFPVSNFTGWVQYRHILKD